MCASVITRAATQRLVHGMEIANTVNASAISQSVSHYTHPNQGWWWWWLLQYNILLVQYEYCTTSCCQG